MGKRFESGLGVCVWAWCVCVGLVCVCVGLVCVCVCVCDFILFTFIFCLPKDFGTIDKSSSANSWPICNSSGPWGILVVLVPSFQSDFNLASISSTSLSQRTPKWNQSSRPWLQISFKSLMRKSSLLVRPWHKPRWICTKRLGIDHNPQSPITNPQSTITIHNRNADMFWPETWWWWWCRWWRISSQLPPNHITSSTWGISPRSSKASSCG